MKRIRWAPSASLAPYVRSYELLETSEAMMRALVPETGLIVGFRYAGSSSLLEGATPRELPRAVITGLRDTTRRMLTAPESGIALIKLRPAGAAAFFDAPLHRLFGQTAALETLIDPREVEHTSARIADARSHAERVRALEELLARRMRAPWREDRRVAAALGAIEADPGAVRIGELARALGLSVDALEKRFRRAVGASPKQLASILRLRRAFDAQRRAGATLAQVALEAGYYDQAHFTRRFAAATGAPPREFFHTTEHC